MRPARPARSPGRPTRRRQRCFHRWRERSSGPTGRRASRQSHLQRRQRSRYGHRHRPPNRGGARAGDRRARSEASSLSCSRRRAHDIASRGTYPEQAQGHAPGLRNTRAPRASRARLSAGGAPLGQRCLPLAYERTRAGREPVGGHRRVGEHVGSRRERWTRRGSGHCKCHWDRESPRAPLMLPASF